MGQGGLSPVMLACVCNILMAFLPSEQRGQVVIFREVTQDYMVAWSALSAVALLKYGESLVNCYPASYPAK